MTTTPKHVPWALDTPGVPHPASLGRMVAHDGTAGATGVIASAGGGVIQTPGKPMSVTVLPGGYVAKSTYDGDFAASYRWTLNEGIQLDIDVAPSTSARRDMVVAIVHDWIREGRVIQEKDKDGSIVKAGDDPLALEYIEYRVIKSVGIASTVSQKALIKAARDRLNTDSPIIPLALIYQPAGSTSIDGRVEEIYETTSYRWHRDQILYPVQERQALIGPISTYRNYGQTFPYDIPDWATRMVAVIHAESIYVKNVSSSGMLSAETLGQNFNGAWWDWELGTGRTISRNNVSLYGGIRIAQQYRGTTQTMRMKATNIKSGAEFGMDEKTQMRIELEFYEDPKAANYFKR